MSSHVPQIPSQDQALVPPATSWSWDIATALILGLLLAAPYGTADGAPLITSTLLCCSLIMRSNLPRIALAAGVCAALLQVALVSTPTPSIVVAPLIIYSVSRWSTQSGARLALLAGLTGSVVGPLRWITTSAGGWSGADTVEPDYTLFSSVLPALVISAFGCMAMVTAAYMLGRRRRDSVIGRMQRQVAEEERQRHVLAERSQLDKINTVNERQRIARELHDIVAHSLSVIVVQAEGGKAIAGKRPEMAPQVLETIADTGRDALVEMRRIVGLLRNGGEELSDTFVPSPGLDDLADLAERTGNARLVLRGALPSVSQAFALTVYRVVQESLTNVLKHGGPGARAIVTVTTYSDRLEVIIADDGRGAATVSDGLGNGLRGMRERLTVHGGMLDARPRTGGGFVVRALVPLEYGQPPQPRQHAVAHPDHQARPQLSRPTQDPNYHRGMA